MKKRIGVVIIILILGVLLGRHCIKKQSAEPACVGLIRRSLSVSVTERGRIESRNDYTVLGKTESRILSVPVQEGQWVEAGSSLIVTDTSESEQKWREATSDLQARDIDYRRNDELLKNKKILFEAGTISKEEWIEAQKLADISEAQKNSAKARAQFVKINFLNHLYTAPQRFLVAKVGAEKGAVIMPGNFLIKLIDPFQLKIDIFVSEFEAAKLKVGQVGWVTLPSQKSVRIQSRVTHIQPILEKIGETYALKVTVEFNVTDNALIKPGNQAEVHIMTETVSQAWTLPAKVLNYENDRCFVQIKTPKGSRNQTVEVGVQDGDYVEIKRGLAPSDRVLQL